MSQTRTIEVILNSTAGLASNEEVRDRLLEMFQHHGVDARVAISTHGAQVLELASIAAERSDVVVAAGGDGTINSVASAVIPRKKILGVLPLGTLNHFARDLDIPVELEAAVHTIVSGQIAIVDVGEVNGQIFLNNSSLGLYPSIVTERQKKQRLGHGKWPAFVWAALSVFRRYPFLNVRLSAAGQQVRTRTPFVFIGNNQYEMEGFKIGERATLNSCVLSLYVTLRTSRWGLIRLAFRALLRQLRYEKDFLFLSTDQAWIETRRKRLRVARDGEVSIMQSPLHYRVRCRDLRVLVSKRDHD
jgi:diacylglycerol kinase family enzyme